MQADIAILVHDLASAEPTVRRKAAEQLARRGPAASAAAPALCQAAGDENEAVRDWADSALQDLGPPHESDLGALAELLQSTPSETAYWAATLLGRSCTPVAKVVDGLQNALPSRRETAVRERIVWALGRMGSAASVAAGAIEAVANEPACPPRLARLCHEALQSMGRPPANPLGTRPNAT